MITSGENQQYIEMDQALKLLMQIDEENQALVQNQQSTSKPQEQRNIFSSICYIIQLIILIILVFLVFKFALINRKHQKIVPQLETLNVNEIDNMVTDDSLILDKEDQDIMQFLMSPEDVTSFDNFLPEPDEETFEELIFEAQPWNEGQLQGWQFKNGLTLIVEEKENIQLSTLEFILYHGYHDDEYSSFFMNLLKKSQCAKAYVIQRAYISKLIVNFKNEFLDQCINQFIESLGKEYTQQDIDDDYSISTSDTVSKIDLTLDSISLNNEFPNDQLEIQDFQNYIELVLVSNPVRLIITSPESNQEIYMKISDSQLMNLEFGIQILEYQDLEPILFNQIRVNSNESSIVMLYQIEQNHFFQHLLLQTSSQSLQKLLECTFEILDYNFLAISIQDCNLNSTQIANSIYSYASFLKRQNEKILINSHKDFYNLQILEQQYINDVEFSKKDFNNILDSIQSGVIIFEFGKYEYQELKTMTKEEFYNSNIVNKKIQDVEYSNILIDYSLITSPNETLISQLKLPNLTMYIPSEQPKYNFYTNEPFIPPQIIIDDLVQQKNEVVSVEPEYKSIQQINTFNQEQSVKNYLLPQLTPILISQELWWQYNQNTNKVFIGMQIYKPLNGVNLPKSKAIMKIAQVYIEQTSIESLSAGFQFYVESNSKGLGITLLGWSGSFNIVKEQVISVIQEKKNSQKFNQIKNDLKSQFQDHYYLKTQYYMIQYLLPKLMLRPVNDPSEIIKELENLEYDEFQNYLDTMFNDITYSAFVSGYIDIQNAQQLFKEYKPNELEMITKTLSIEINTIFMTKLPAKQKQNAVLKYFQIGQRNADSTAALLLLQLHFSNQQIQVNFKSIGCSDGLLFYLQGSDSVIKLNEQINQLIEHQKYNLTQLQEDLMIQDQNSDEYLWDKIQNRFYNFNEINELKEVIKNISLNDINAILKQPALTIFGVTENQKLPNIPAGQKDYKLLKEKAYYECQYQYQ